MAATVMLQRKSEATIRSNDTCPHHLITKSIMVQDMEGNESSVRMRKAATLPRTFFRPTRLPSAFTISGRGGTLLPTPLLKSKIHVDSFLSTQLGLTSQISVGRVRGTVQGLNRRVPTGDIGKSRLPTPSCTPAKVIGLSQTQLSDAAPGTQLGTEGSKVSSITVNLKVYSGMVGKTQGKENSSGCELDSQKERQDVGCVAQTTNLKLGQRSSALAKCLPLPSSSALPRSSNTKSQPGKMETDVPTPHRRPFYPGPQSSSNPRVTHRRSPLPPWSSVMNNNTRQDGTTVQGECSPETSTSHRGSIKTSPPASEVGVGLGLCRTPAAASEELIVGFPRSSIRGLYQETVAEHIAPPVEVEVQGNVKSLMGFTDSRSETVMSEQVPETRPKPAVAMKPAAGLNPNLLGYIGIDTIIEQMRKKTMRTGFDFNIMVVGQSGLGKSTLVNTLFKSQVSRKSSGWSREDKIPKTVEIKAISHVIEEGGVKMKLTVIDTPGFGDQINNENCWEPIEKFINEQYEKFLKEEVNIARKKRIPDTRVHCCLYFISPTGHSLRPLDMEFMKHLSKVVNIIPVIAKADTMTMEEKIEFKQRVRKELEVNGIEFYPQKEFDEDQEDKSENDKIRDSMPFAVVGSDKEFQVNGKRVLGRRTPWGVIEVENLAHCEFALLRDFVIRTHLQDLKEVTHNIHYETYRAKRLNDNGGLPPVSDDSHESNI